MKNQNNDRRSPLEGGGGGCQRSRLVGPRAFRQLSLLLLILVGWTGSVLAGTNKPGYTVVSGVVRVASTDAAGNVQSIEIMVGEDEQSQDPYLVADTPKGQELKTRVGEYVFVAGDVTEDKLGWKTIAVKKYTLTSELKEPQP